MDINLWSGGEYNNTLNNIQCNQDNQKVIISDEYSINGETSFKIMRGGGTGYNWTRFRVPCTETGKTMTVKCRIYSPNASADIWLCDMNGGSTEGERTSIRVYPSKNVMEISLTYTGKLTTLTHYALRINLLNDDTYLFVDDLSLTSS